MRKDPLKALRLQKRLDEAAEQLHGGQVAQAEAIYTAVLAEDADNAAALHGLGVLKASAGQPAEGERYLRRALAHEPENFRILNDLGEALRIQGKLDEACECFEKALALVPEDAQTLNNLGSAVMESDPERAKASFLAAIQHAPEFVHAYNNLGVLLERQGNLEEALKCYEAAVAIDPGFRLALENHQDLLRRSPELLEATLERLYGQAARLLEAADAKKT